MNGTVKIVRIADSNLHQIQQLGIQTYVETFGPYNTKKNMQQYLHNAFSEERLRKQINDEASEWYFAMLENKHVGYIKINRGNRQTELQDPRSIEIERIYVLQSFHGYKIGKLLLSKAITIANNYRVDYIWLGVWEKNVKATLFYKKHGFVAFSTHTFMLGNDAQTDILMKLVLKTA